MKKLSAVLSAIIILFSCLIVPNDVNTKAATINSKAGIVKTESSRLIVRESASRSSNVVYSLPKDSLVTLISKTDNWYKVEYITNRFGYVSADYIKETNGVPVTVKLSSGTLNVRSGAGTNHPSVGYLRNGAVAIELERANGWSKLLYNGSKIGYASSSFLTANQNYPSISLKVPNFKQNDKRWADVKIGNSGKTIAQIGCVTTALAMTESHRLNTTIYPDAMVKRLNYTASGDVFWPSNYKTVTSSSDYLKAIYDKLKEGKPVVFGSKNKYGSQHWVVITGYTGGSNLTAEGFTINNPGSTTRTNLQQHLNAYPTFYKFLHY